MTMDINHLRQWIGNTQTDEETLSPTIVRKFNATFDRVSATDIGDRAPLLIHFCLTAPITAQSGLGPYGHPALGDFLPPVELPRRMWAGGDLRFHSDIRIGETVRRRSTIKDVVLKRGRSGELCFVTVEHEISSDGRLAVTEQQDIVYREEAKRNQDTANAEPGATGVHSRQITPSATLLFRYSAMTFNGHRIHYDTPYATDVEGYPGLVVHGPMQATLLCQMATDINGMPLKTFKFRSLSPIFDNADFVLNAEPEGNKTRLWTTSVGGPMAMEATAEW